MAIFDRSLAVFLLIGVGNTALSFVIMQTLYALNLGGYWLSSAFAFALTSVLSFFLNKRYSFRNKDSLSHTAWRFSLVIALCYVLAYSIARPAVAFTLNALMPQSGFFAHTDQIAMAAGQVIFTGLNYLGQRFFAFKPRTREGEDTP